MSSSINDSVDYASYGTYLFLDSNLILEGKPLGQQPWHSLGKSGPILLVCVPTVIREIDSKKQHGRLATKARDFNRLVRHIVVDGGAVSLTNGVDLTIASCAPINWNQYPYLDSTLNDDRIVAEVIATRFVDHSKSCLIGQDIGPLMTAKRHGVSTLHVTDDWLSEPEPSPHEKEARRLAQELKALKNTEPSFDISIDAPSPPIALQKVAAISDEDVAKYSRIVISNNPKPKQRSGDPFLNPIDHTLDERYQQYLSKEVPSFVANLTDLLEVFYNQYPFTVWVKNSGNIQAENMVVEIAVSSGWLNSRPIFVPTHGPSAPTIKPILDRHMYGHLQVPLGRVNVGRHELKIEPSSRDGNAVIECADYRHGEERAFFDGVLWLDPSDPRDCVIDVRITASNMRGETRRVFKLAKVLQQVEVADLLSVTDLHRTVDPPIWVMIDQLLAAKQYKQIEILPAIKDS